MPGRETVYIEYMGCPQRALDAGRFSDFFLKNGFKISKMPKHADHILFISCAFRNTDEEFALKRIKELSRYKARLILGGCLNSIDQERLNGFFRGPAVDTSDPAQIDRLFPHLAAKFSEIPDTNRLYPRSKIQLFRLYADSMKRLDINCLKSISDFIKRKDHKRYWYVRAAWGCVKEHCSYCSVWRAVGEFKSKSVEDCVRELKEGLRCGYKNILITADNLGAYGSDIGLTLPNLLEELIEIHGNYKIQLENVHPFWLLKYLDDFLSLFRLNKIRAVLCPVQSGNDRILGLMNRRYQAGKVRMGLLKIKEASPGIELYTHIIAGFPSETESEFDQTLTLVKEAGFNFIHITGYHKRPGANDKGLLGQAIPSDAISKRIQRAERFLKQNKIGYFVYPE